MAELFEQLLSFKWRDVEIPVSDMRMEIAHDLVEHRYWGVDGADVEATGLAPIRFSAKSPLINKISPGKSESWGALYPAKLRELLVAFQQKADGVLQHPEFGDVNCKAERLTIQWDGNRRGGADADLSWIASGIDRVTDFAPSPVQEIAFAAQNLDAMAGDIRALAPEFPKYQSTFADLARALQGIGDQVQLLSYRGAGQIDAIVYRASNLADSLRKTRNVLTWPAVRESARINAAAFELRENLRKLSRTVKVYRVAQESTLSAIAIATGSRIGDLVSLNPALMTSPVVPAGASVRYYVSKVPL